MEARLTLNVETNGRSALLSAVLRRMPEDGLPLYL